MPHLPHFVLTKVRKVRKAIVPATRVHLSRQSAAKTEEVKMVDDWFWASAADIGIPAGDRFVIENGQEALWRRVRREIDANEQCNWMPVNRFNKGSDIEDILDMLITVVPTCGVNHNRFILEAAKIPVFAQFLRNGRSDLCNYVSNSLLETHEPYSDDKMRKLGNIVSSAICCEPDWF